MKRTLIIFLLSTIVAIPARAQEESSADYIKGKLISAYEGLGKMPTADIGLDISFSPDWYSYWRMPGDNGLAPTFDWKSSENVKSVDVSWPAPTRYTFSDMHSFIYKEHVLFPLTVTPEVPGKDINLDLNLTMVVCHDICVPQTVHLTKKIEAKAAVQTTSYNDLKIARQNLPATKNTEKLSIDTAVLGKDSIVVSASAKHGFGDQTDVMIESQDVLITAPPEVLRDGDDKSRVVFKIKAPEGTDLTQQLFGKKVTILLVNGKDAIEREFSF